LYLNLENTASEITKPEIIIIQDIKLHKILLILIPPSKKLSVVLVNGVCAHHDERNALENLPTGIYILKVHNILRYGRKYKRTSVSNGVGLRLLAGHGAMPSGCESDCTATSSVRMAGRGLVPRAER
jgi:hypothetical protein